MESILFLGDEYVDKLTGFTYRCVYNKTETFCLHHHNYYEIFLTVSGETVHTVNGATFILPEGSLVFVRPNDSHLYTNREDRDYIFANLTFSCVTAEELFNYISDCTDIRSLLDSEFPPIAHLSNSEKNTLFGSLNMLNTIDVNDISQKKLYFRYILFEIFTKYFAHFKPNRTDIPIWLETAVREIKKPENFLYGTKLLKELCNKTDEHICRCVKKYYNQTPTELVNEIRLNYVANMLITTNMPVTDLCYECGFENISWFYTVFKCKYGLTPKAFRDKYNKKII